MLMLAPMNQSDRSRLGGKAPRKPFRFGIHDIAEARGKSLAAVRKDRSRGKFDPNDLRSLASYVAAT